MTCEHNCQPIKCPNYILCKTIAPQWLFYCHGGMCMNCNILFGTWKGGNGKPKIIDNMECPICLDTKACISQPKCKHFTCIDCFKRCYWGDENYDIENKPKFPYDSEIEEEYYDNTEDPKWENDELIIKYNKEDEEWERKREEHFNKEENLKQCPLCRK